MRQAFVRVQYDNVDISADIAQYLIGFTYTDESHGKQDSISILLHDRDKVWRNAWWPQKGATITASIKVENWKYEGDSRALHCGTFQIDEIIVSGKPWTLEIKGVAVPVSAPLRNTRKTRAWQSLTLEDVLKQIADESGMDAFYDSSAKSVFARIDQRNETDAQFLARIAKDAGLCFKATDSQLILYDLIDYEKKESAFTVSIDGDDVTNFSITSKSDDTYTACTVTYWDATKQQILTYTYDPEKEAKKKRGKTTGGIPDDGGDEL